MNFLYDLDFGHLKRKLNATFQTKKKEEKSIQKIQKETDKDNCRQSYRESIQEINQNAKFLRTLKNSYTQCYKEN